MTLPAPRAGAGPRPGSARELAGLSGAFCTAASTSRAARGEHGDDPLVVGAAGTASLLRGRGARTRRPIRLRPKRLRHRRTTNCGTADVGQAVPVQKPKFLLARCFLRRDQLRVRRPSAERNQPRSIDTNPRNPDQSRRDWWVRLMLPPVYPHLPGVSAPAPIRVLVIRVRHLDQDAAQDEENDGHVLQDHPDVILVQVDRPDRVPQHHDGREKRQPPPLPGLPGVHPDDRAEDRPRRLDPEEPGRLDEREPASRTIAARMPGASAGAAEGLGRIAGHVARLARPAVCLRAVPARGLGNE